MTTTPNTELTPLVPRTVPFKVACHELGFGRTAAYDAVRQGTFPIPVIRLGRRLVVARADLERLLGGEAGR